MTRGVQERSERTRERLVHAGAELFHRHGYADASLSGIAARAGVTKGALYFHFTSKEELAHAVLQRGRDLLDGAQRQLRAAGVSPLQSLIDLTYWLARTLQEEPAVRAGFRIARERAGRLPPASDLHHVWISTVWELLRQARAAGQLRRHPRHEGPQTLVAAAVCVIEVMSQTEMPYGELRQRIGALWDLMVPALVPPGAAAVRTWPHARCAAQGMGAL
ncbi:ScbR family autoregulator-binding transcription factor [Streptomyces sp. NPDC050147]|uniref:ScbR family autoregulator-binding transcription factor n=1 Tax=Streptomyces sp. NPDC050147 TaxID=3155513 RepID=UPI00343FBA1B